MAIQFKGVYLRDTISDDGTVPSHGNVWKSPDIIAVKTQFDHPNEEFKNWNQRYGTALEFGQDNYVYIRCHNTASEQRTGIVNLFWSPSSLFLHPSVWTHNKLFTTDGHDSLVFPYMQSREKRVGIVPFKFNPPKNIHVCLIGVVMDEEHCREIPSDADINDFSKWVRDHANVAWHNLTVVDHHQDKSYRFVTQITNPEANSLTFQISTRLQNSQLGTKIENKLAGLSIMKQEMTTKTDRSLDYSVDIPKGTHELDVIVTAPENENLPSDLEIDVEASVPGHPQIGGVHVQLHPHA